jgi:predicted small lipoprotein YifL
MRRILLCLAISLCIGGCGLKGPLYFPSDKPAPKQPAKPAPTTPATGSGQPS